MNILVVDQCSKAKNHDTSAKSFTADDIDSHSLAELRDRPGTPALKARRLYAGRQQQYINQAVDKLRSAGDTVDRYFISAGFGLVDETEVLPPYDVTFASFSREAIRARADKLGIQSVLLELLERDYELIYLSLGQDYYATFDLETILKHADPDSWVVCFNHGLQTAEFPNAVSLPARTEDAKDQGTITVALKGRYLQNFAEHRSNGREIETASDIRESCMSSGTDQSNLDEPEF